MPSEKQPARNASPISNVTPQGESIAHLNKHERRVVICFKDHNESIQSDSNPFELSKRAWRGAESVTFYLDGVEVGSLLFD